MLLGEFGAGVATRDSARYIEAFYDWLDARFVSSTQWNYTPGWTPERKDGWNREDFSITGANQELRSALFEPRAYPQKTAGTPLAFERSDRGFTYRWRNDPSLGATELFILETQTVSSTVGVSCLRQGRLLVCTGDAGEVSVSAE
jgi:hypothetical protein